MSLNIVVDAISSSDFKSVTKEILVSTATIAAQTDKDECSADATGVGTLTNPANNTNPERGYGWIVPGSVKVYRKSEATLALQDYTGSGSTKVIKPTTLAKTAGPTNQDDATGTINYATGAVTLDFETDLTNAEEIYITISTFQCRGVTRLVLFPPL